MNSIPASKFVSVVPSVLGSGGSPLTLNAVFLTKSTRVPIGTVMGFSSVLSVQNFFGVGSVEALMAGVYFLGFSGSTRLPGTLYFSQYAATAVAGYARSGSFAGVTLSQLQALSGVLTLSVDGVSHTSAAIDLSTATSFTNAAALVQAGLLAGTPSSTATVTYDSQLSAFVITSPTTGVTSAVTYATGTLSAGLKLTAATGAVLSAGAAPYVPGAAMDAIVNVTQNWATFTHTWEPVDSDKILFATWANTASAAGAERFVYVAETTDITLTQGPASQGSFVQATSAFNGRAACYSDPTVVPQYGLTAAFLCGYAGAINWSAPNGRATSAYRSSSALTPSVTSRTASDNLDANGVNYYAAVATANQSFQYLFPGAISGQWLWVDDYIDQIYLNSQFQLALLSYLTAVNAVPYNDNGYSQLRAAMRGPIDEAVNNGTIRKGITLSPAQIAALTQATGGIDISGTLFAQGWYLQILDPGAIVRGQRGSPNMTFWYTDGGAIQKLNLASVDIL